MCDIGNRLKNKGLRVTPQRVAVLSTLLNSKSHPDADQIVRVVRNEHSNISVGTIYHILDNLVQKGIIKKVQTNKNVVRYDAILDTHFHLYSVQDNRIDDYFDEELLMMIKSHFDKKGIRGFELNDISLQLIGDFK